MANTSTLVDTIPCYVKGTSKFYNVYMYKVAFDTNATDLTIRTPSDTTLRLGVVGWEHCESIGHSITVASGTVGETQTVLTVFDFAANNGISRGLDSAAMITCAKGKSLVMQTSASPLTLVIYVIEFASLEI